jgi:outer membrane receptor protein involved in Fe transport
MGYAVYSWIENEATGEVIYPNEKGTEMNMTTALVATTYSSHTRLARWLVGSVCLALAATLAAQPQPTDPPSAERQPFQGGAQTIVVTASRSAQQLAHAPASVTVISGDEIEHAAADDYGDLLRNVPGLNVAQTSVRDINMTGRGATSTLSNSQLALLDGRSVYLDFFGFVMWDLLPVQASESEDQSSRPRRRLGRTP